MEEKTENKLQQIEDFFKLLFGKIDKPYFLTLWSDKDKRTTAFPIENLGSAADAAMKSAENGNAYFAVGLRRVDPGPWKRGSLEDIAAIGAFWMDLDIEGPNHACTDLPKTEKEAMDFVESLLLKPTVIIHSGGGLQVYWVLREPILIETSRQRAEVQDLSRAWQEYVIRNGRERGFCLDNTSDLPRVLRVPWTKNFKQNPPLDVKVSFFEPDRQFDVADFQKIVGKGERHSIESPATEEAGPSDHPQADKVAENCAWLRHCRDDAGVLREPEWFGMLGILAHCAEGNRIAHEWSQPFPRYSTAETGMKLQHAMKAGPRLCENVRHVLGGEAYCSRCVFWGHFRSPISLGVQSESSQRIIAGVKILAGSVGDRGLPFLPENLAVLDSLKKTNAATYARLRDGLAKQGVSIQQLEREMKKHAFQSTDSFSGEQIQYFEKNCCFFHIRQTSRGEEYVQLSNFTAHIIEEIVKDDGLSGEILYKIQGKMDGQQELPIVEVPTRSYKSLNWVAEKYGSKAVVYAGAGTQDHFRVAIQLLSGQVARRQVYTHTGWRQRGTDWVYLTTSGALGKKGLDAKLQVELDDQLNFYSLPGLPDGVSLTDAILASLHFLDVAPHEITLPLLAAVYRAPLGEALRIDFSVFIHGFTGSFKSEIAALAQAHYGCGFNGKNLPASWESTANSLEKLAFMAKDSILVVDDYLPGPTIHDVGEMRRKADRLLRAQGNLSGRGRMNSDLTLRRTFRARGLILSSAEDVPPGQSLRARMFIIELPKGKADLKVLTDLQKKGATGILAGAMAEYIRFLAPQMDTLPEILLDRKIVYRDAALEVVKAHARTPDVIASLFIGMETFLDFATQSKAISHERASDLREETWNVLCAADQVQQELQESEDPVKRFFNLLSTALLMGDAHLEDATSGGQPAASPEKWGWATVNTGTGTQLNPRGKIIGWTDNKSVFLDPSASYVIALTIAGKQGVPLAISEIVLRKRLDERGLLLNKPPKGLVKTMVIAGTKRKIIEVAVENFYEPDDPSLLPELESPPDSGFTS